MPAPPQSLVLPALDPEFLTDLRLLLQQLLTSLAESYSTMKSFIANKEHAILSALDTTLINLIKNLQFETRFLRSDLNKELQERFFQVLDKRQRLKFIKELDEIVGNQRMRIHQIVDLIYTELLTKLPHSRSREVDIARLGR